MSRSLRPLRRGCCGGGMQRRYFQTSFAFRRQLVSFFLFRQGCIGDSKEEPPLLEIWHFLSLLQITSWMGRLCVCFWTLCLALHARIKMNQDSLYWFKNIQKLPRSPIRLFLSQQRLRVAGRRCWILRPYPRTCNAKTGFSQSAAHVIQHSSLSGRPFSKMFRTRDWCFVTNCFTGFWPSAIGLVKIWWRSVS